MLNAQTEERGSAESTAENVTLRGSTLNRTVTTVRRSFSGFLWWLTTTLVLPTLRIALSRGTSLRRLFSLLGFGLTVFRVLTTGTPFLTVRLLSGSNLTTCSFSLR